jgi:imidazolonepropionase-like amidohydrolase
MRLFVNWSPVILNRFLRIGFWCCWASAASAQVTVIRNVTLIDPGASLIGPHWSVAIAEGKIRAIGVIAEPPGAKIVDGTGRFLIPGLWDMHVHLWNAKNLPELYLAFGVTGVRDMGSSFESTTTLRRSIEDGSAVGPHILTSGPGLDGKAGDEPRLPILVVSTPDEARKAVDQINDMGADFVKIFTGIELEPYMALLERARQLRLPVAGHLPTKVRIEDAIELKQASIEHFFGLERVSEARLRKAFTAAAQQGVRFTPTLSMHKRTLLQGLDAMTSDPRVQLIPEELRKDWGDPKKDFAGASADFKERAPRTYVRYQEMTRWLKQSGVLILAGSDTGDPFTIPGGSLLDELTLLVEAGLTPMEALRGATSEAASFMKLEQMFGSVQLGQSADLVLLDGDPLTDIGNVRRIAGVMWRGHYYDKGGIEKLKGLAAR